MSSHWANVESPGPQHDRITSKLFNVISCCFPNSIPFLANSGSIPYLSNPVILFLLFHTVFLVIADAIMQQQPHGNSEDGEEHMSRHTATIEILDGPHQQAVRLAVSNILKTEIAETTYAQIVDGLPLVDVVSDVYGGDWLFDDHPICAHTELSAGILETTRKFRTSFDLGTLSFDSTVLTHSFLITSSF
jgi:hypothetical protein